ncbi:MAG: flagellar basal body rod protein FlgB [Tepidimonas ignava]|jgi:flagellar basal-body rod protein FlgB|uniref:Flagellar basal body rod protein FlgB n=1 Tax=Tepidimonas ignava TaxID=114249 RepID=A0A4R3LAU1_9BURK|nr:flagellar basal body rod protein FlgB [Tepidimonas ignava]MCX7813910.1 flagellar basal body rod protein FlgB [Tepidimonas ignava]TCS96265.1 flagellar basal-body rod protein FlgB [Tepidimonas ignava]TSE23610.1 Flagellar basal body rod protein FlgB [Tepidimonas ignava]
MLNRMTERMDFLGQALQLRAWRQQVIASNIANAETPGYIAREVDFRAALQQAQRGASVTPTLQAGSAPNVPLAGDDARHLRTVHSAAGVVDRTRVAYQVRTQPSLDQNTVDMDQQRANFVDNAVQYESTLRFINGHVKTMLAAIQGQ